MTSTMRTAGRPRDESVHEALLTATQELLCEQGFDRLSVDSVAARAGVGKAAIYRRWSGKTELVVAAVADLAHVPDVPDTGGLRGDLIASARTYVQNERTQKVLAGLMTAMVHHEQLRSAAREAIGEPSARLFRLVVARAVAHRATAPGVDVDAVAELFPAMAFHRTAALGRPIDDEFIERVVDGLLLPLLTSTA
jgi:AcrR family transcriptional regulator